MSSNREEQSAMTEPPTFEWHRRADFAEIAEALGGTTEDRRGASPEPKFALVLYTRTPETHDPDPTVYGAWLVRDARGIFKVRHRSGVGPVSNFLPDLPW